jgi:hypothetical protein
MAALTPLKPSGLTGTDPAFVAADALGDTFPNRAATLMVRNTDTVAHTVTIRSFATLRPGIMRDDIEVAVPAGATRVVKGFGVAEVGNDTGQVELTYDAVTGVTVAVIE